MKKIFYFDNHIAVVREFQDIVAKTLGAAVSLEGWLTSGHSWVLGREADRVEVVNASTWKALDRGMIDDFHRVYDGYLSQFDAFFVGYPSSFALLFSKYKKPIIASNCVRYDMPFCWSRNVDMLNFLNGSLAELHAEGRLVVVSNNLADHDYFQSAPHGVPSTLIPTLGEYAKLRWSPETGRSLIYSGEQHFPACPNAVPRSTIGKFAYETLGTYGSIAQVPYEVSTMSMAEQYAGGIPLLFPSENLLLRLWKENEGLLQSRYWFHGGGVGYPGYLARSHAGDFRSWWVSRADFFHHLSEVNYFDSFDEYRELINENNFLNLKRATAPHLENRRRRTMDAWRQVFDRIGLVG